MESKQFKKSIPSSIPEAKKVILELLNYLEVQKIPLSEDDLFDLKLVFSELIYNAVIHGNKENISKRVDIYLTISDNALLCVITDEGIGFDYEELFNEYNSDNLDFLFDEHGRGVKLALSLVDDLKYNDIGNSIKVLKRLRVNG